ncbi:SH3 domain-containing protein [Bartonella tamiae]|uniref:SH3b domain-containing protein n=1 Tax=Bartonella tamiae Th239 TaxID=1094558 RepID=J1K1Q8_9HYPH|nr:SH3 domain-containing protein [Bartonella tamiae]EJF90990.1 hypothetical protein ME5_00322 [Bartonella tamiae Th239]EJF93345.1 hypothetical protein MEG_01559 [Bartonella tamiae Th307]
MGNWVWLRFFIILSSLCVYLNGLSLNFDQNKAHAQEASQNDSANLGPSGLPLPRFVSIKPTRVNVRVGPGRNYSVIYSYQKQGLPIEITQEYDQWRKIRDSDGDEGWVYQSLVSGQRTAMIAPWAKDKSTLIAMYREPNETSNLAAQLEAGVIGRIRQCDGNWCELTIGRTRGWVNQNQIWGAYPGEKITN